MRYWGEPVAAVVEATTQAAEAAPRSIDAEYELLPVCFSNRFGETASFNVIDASTIQEAFRTQPDLIVFRKGQVLAEAKTCVTHYF